MAQPYPISREAREEEIFFGDGGASYGPFDLKIFDVEDVLVWQRAEDAEEWTEAAPTVTKTAGLAFDTFSIAFPYVIPVTTKIKVLSARVPERSAGVTNGTRIDPNALEKELTKLATVQQEMRRDIGRGIQVQFGAGYVMADDLEDGDTLMKSGARVVKGPSAGDITLAQGYAEAAADSAEAAADTAVEVENTANALVSLVAAVPLVFASVAAASAYVPILAPDSIQTVGYHSLFDDGGAHYKKVISEPGHPGKFSLVTALGAAVWYELAEKSVCPEMLGGRCSSAYDDAPAMQAAVDGWRNVHCTPTKTYYPRSRVTMSVSDTKLAGDGTATIFVDKAYFNNNNPYMAGDSRIATVNAGAGGWALNSTGRYGTNAVVLYVRGSEANGGARNERSRVSGVKFLGNNPVGLMQTVVLVRNTRDFEICDCDFTGFGMGYCILAGGTRNTKIHDNVFRSLLESGIYPATSAGDAADCAPNVTAIASTNDFLALHGSNWKGMIYNNRVETVHFTGSGLARHGDQSDGINLTEMGEQTRWKVTGNHIEDVAEGMDIFDRFCDISHNHLFDCNIFGLKFTYGAQFNIVNHNIINNSGAAAIVLDSPNGYETRNNNGVGNILYNADPTTYTDNGLIQFSSSGTGSTHSNSFLDGEYAPVSAKTIVRNTPNIGSNPPNKVTGRVLGVGTHADPKQRYCSQSWAGLDFRSQTDSFVSAALGGAQNAAASNVSTKVQFVDTAGRDELGEYDNGAYRFTPLFPGYYQVEVQVRLSGLATTDAMVLQVYKASGGLKNIDGMGRSDGACTLSISALLYLTPVIGGTDDYIEISVAQSNAAVKAITTLAAYTNLSIRRV